ncbi:MAG TPA: cryptochrome/photolyase family protein [Candidatus Limnocylindrales bacterium]|nr:cryptochrome/photolyase family protein [Candidatus Limnocylindrales bacterium]
MKSVLLLYPHQLYPLHDLPKVDTVMMINEPLYYGLDSQLPRRVHKQKLILHRASMRRYAEEVLWPAGFKVDYIELDVFAKSGDIFERVSKAEQIYIIDPTDDVLTRRLLQARRERPELPNVTFLPSPNFYLKEEEVRQYFTERHKHPFAEFYQWQRERFNVLIGDNYKPVGGKWAFEAKAQKLAPNVVLPSFPVFGDNKFVTEALAWVAEHFPDNPGSSEFIWPTNHSEAQIWLHDFLENRIDDYGTYQETLSSQAPWLYHSLLEGSLNIGLLKPQEIIQAALARHAARPVPLQSLESFIRQVLGWREYVRGIYLHQATALRAQNPFNHHRKLTGAWYTATTGLPPLDNLIKKISGHAYAHSAERCMIAGNLMILCEIEPSQICQWQQELLIDAYDWTVVTDVNSMSQFDAWDDAGGGKAYIAPSSAVLDISDYDRGVWSDIWDGLFWRFIEKHQSSLSKSPRMRVMARRLDRLDADHKRIIYYRAEDFLRQHTSL